jgi:methionine-rich copper-binding protein CopC
LSAIRNARTFVESEFLAVRDSEGVAILHLPTSAAQHRPDRPISRNGAGHRTGARAVSIEGAQSDTTPPALSVSTPADGARNVPIDQNIVLVFSENVQVGTGNITIKDHGDDRTIAVTDASQVSVSGNQVTINPTTDLTSNGNYDVRIDAGAITGSAGNAFAGGDAVHFRTARGEDNLVLAALETGHAFQVESSSAIDIRAATLTATDGTSLWSGSANLGSDRVALVSDAAHVAVSPAPPIPVWIEEAAIAWQSEPNAIVEGNLPIHPPYEPLVAHDAVHSVIADTLVVIVTFEGLA